jgi:ribosomal protein L11 methyltransferase
VNGGGEAAPIEGGPAIEHAADQASDQASDRWRSVRVWPSVAGENGREAIVAALFALGSTGVHEDGEMLVTFFPADAVGDDMLLRTIAGADTAARVEMGYADGQEWVRRWPARVGCHVVGSLTVAPPWLAAGCDPARTIVIDPGMAFGTGEHETTRGALRLLSEVIRPGDIVADLGAGSAVLAIAAAKLGAARVAAIEMDADAIGNAEENVRRNGVSDRVRVIEGFAQMLLPLVAPVRVVTANIISSVVIELLPAIMSGLTNDGQAILSGILRDERASMLAVLDESGWRVEREDAEGEWWSTIVAR